MAKIIEEKIASMAARGAKRKALRIIS